MEGRSGRLPGGEFVNDQGPLTDRMAAGALLRVLVCGNANPETCSLIVSRLRPGDMFQVEYMMILEAAQKLHSKDQPITLSALEAELLPEDPGGLAIIVLRSLYEDRDFAMSDINDVEELVNFLIAFRNEP